MTSELEAIAGGSGAHIDPTTDLCMRQLWPQIEGLLVKGVTMAAISEALARLAVKAAHHRCDES